MVLALELGTRLICCDDPVPFPMSKDKNMPLVGLPSHKVFSSENWLLEKEVKLQASHCGALLWQCLSLHLTAMLTLLNPRRKVKRAYKEPVTVV